jgi:GntR family transcriptional regulator
MPETKETPPATATRIPARSAAIGQRIVESLHVGDYTKDLLYLQLARTMRGLIETGELRGGEALPSERDLAKVTGFSRITVRSAIDELFRDGLISKRRGAGTFVSPQIDQPLSVLLGFTADMKRRGAQTNSIIINKTVALPDPNEVLKLGLSPSDQILRLSRVRLTEDDPLAIEHAVVPLSALAPDDIEDSLYAALKRSGHMPVRALQRLHAAIADDREAELLDVVPGSPILHIERRSFLANGRPIEITKSAYRGDRYDFIAELTIEQ